jgi:enoyl-CoA hydratase/carnithine racemase
MDLGPDGTPRAPLHVLDLDPWASAPASAIEEEADRVGAALAVTIGTASSPPTPALAPLVGALSLTLAPTGTSDRGCVPVDDPGAELAAITQAVAARPRAAVLLGQLLRGTAVMPTGPALAAEAATYSVLLGGPEFAAWRSGRPTREPDDRSTGDRVRMIRSDDSLELVLDRPDRRNALDAAARAALADALDLVLLDTTVRRVHLRGAGPVFSAGGDLDEFGTATDLSAAALVRLERAPWRQLDLLGRRGVRTEVTVQGAAVGAGLEIAAFAGHVRCLPDAWFALPELGMGLVPGAGGTVSVPRRIGRHRATWLMLTGHRLDAATALAWGLVDEIVAP